MLNPFVENLMSTNSKRDLVQGTDYRALPGDQSLLLGNKLPTSEAPWIAQGANFYTIPITRFGVYRVSIYGKLECDDHRNDLDFVESGEWVFYIR